jgi:hypothetical protein
VEDRYDRLFDTSDLSFSLYLFYNS